MTVPVEAEEEAGERFATLRAWTHWVMKNPLDEHQLAHAKSTNDLFALLETREARIAQLEAELRRAREALRKIAKGSDDFHERSIYTDMAVEALAGDLGDKK